jgi:hypothetical protein
MKNLLRLVAVGEGAFGVVLVVYPPIVIKLLFGVEIAGAAVVMSRVTGIALIGLGVGCWPECKALCGMLTYSALATLYLGYIAIRGESVGVLLWPAVVLHAVLTLLLVRACLKPRENTST